MSKVSFGQPQIFNLSNTHHDIWNTNKRTISRICDTKFKPAKFEDNTEKVKIGKTYLNRKVKILQFSEQIKQTNSRNDFNPVELRIAYMKKHHSDYENQENPGYNRSAFSFVNLTNLTKKAMPEKIFNPFETKNSNPFELKIKNPFEIETKQKPNPFEIKFQKNPFNAPAITNSKKSMTKFAWPKASPTTPKPTSNFVWPKIPEPKKPTISSSPKISTPTTPFVWPAVKISNPNCGWPKSWLDNNDKKPATQTSLKILPQKSSQVNPKPEKSNSTDTLISQFYRNELIKSMEVRNSIESALIENPYPNQASAIKPVLQRDQYSDQSNSMTMKMTSESKRFLLKSPKMRSKTDVLKKPKSSNGKSKSKFIIQTAITNNFRKSEGFEI